MPEVTNGDSYLHIDDDAPSFADKDSYDDDNIVEEVVSKRAQVEESLTAKDDDEDGEPMMTHTAARHSVQLLQHYFVVQGFDDDAHASLDVCTNLVYSGARASSKQTTLDSFLR